MFLLAATLIGVVSAQGDFLFPDTQHFEPIYDKEDHRIDCGLPPFTTVLPLNYRRELRKIWSGKLIDPRKCERELMLTRELVEALPENLKLKVVAWGGGSAILTGATPKTPFLVGLSPIERQHFARILTNRSLTEPERIEELRSWAVRTLSSEALNNFEQYLVFLGEKARRLENKVESLSQEARKAYDALENIRKEKQKIFDSLSETARKELAALWRVRCPRPTNSANRVTIGVLPPQTTDLDAEELHLACSRMTVEEREIRRSSSSSTSSTTTSTPPPSTTSEEDSDEEVATESVYTTTEATTPEPTSTTFTTSTSTTTTTTTSEPPTTPSITTPSTRRPPRWSPISPIIRFRTPFPPLPTTQRTSSSSSTTSTTDHTTTTTENPEEPWSFFSTSTTEAPPSLSQILRTLFP